MAKILQFTHMKWLKCYLKPPMDRENFGIYSSETAKMTAKYTRAAIVWGEGQGGVSKFSKIVVWGL